MADIACGSESIRKKYKPDFKIVPTFANLNKVENDILIPLEQRKSIKGQWTKWLILVPIYNFLSFIFVADVSKEGQFNPTFATYFRTARGIVILILLLILF